MYWYVFIYPVILDLQITFQCMYMHINAKAYIDVYFTCTCGFFCCRWHHMWMLIQCKIFDSWNVLPKNMYFTLMKLDVKKGILHTIFVNKIWYSFYLFPFKILPFWHFIYVFFFYYTWVLVVLYIPLSLAN